MVIMVLALVELEPVAQTEETLELVKVETTTMVVAARLLSTPVVAARLLSTPDLSSLPILSQCSLAANMAGCVSHLEVPCTGILVIAQLTLCVPWRACVLS